MSQAPRRIDWSGGFKGRPRSRPGTDEASVSRRRPAARPERACSWAGARPAASRKRTSWQRTLGHSVPAGCRGGQRHALKLWLAQLWLGVRVGLWISVLPLVLRTTSLRHVLQALTPAARPPRTTNLLTVDQTVWTAVRVCRMRLFRLPLFPRSCLRHALALYYALAQDHPVTIHFAVTKDGSRLEGHSWVTLHGRPIGDDLRAAGFKTIYRYPPSGGLREQSLR